MARKSTTGCGPFTLQSGLEMRACRHNIIMRIDTNLLLLQFALVIHQRERSCYSKFDQPRGGAAASGSRR